MRHKFIRRVRRLLKSPRLASLGAFIFGGLRLIVSGRQPHIYVDEMPQPPQTALPAESIEGAEDLFKLKPAGLPERRQKERQYEPLDEFFRPLKDLTTAGETAEAAGTLFAV